MSNIDDNRDYIILAEYNGLATPVKCDSSGNLIIEFVMGTDVGSDKSIAIDNNRIYPSQSENSSNTSQVLVTDSNGVLVVDTTSLIIS